MVTANNAARLKRGKFPQVPIGALCCDSQISVMPHLQ